MSTAYLPDGRPDTISVGGTVVADLSYDPTTKDLDGSTTKPVAGWH